MHKVPRPGHLCNQITILFYFADKSMAIQRGAVPVGVQLEVDSRSGHRCHFLRVHKLEEAFPAKGRVVKAYGLGKRCGQIVLLFSGKVLLFGVVVDLPEE